MPLKEEEINALETATNPGCVALVVDSGATVHTYCAKAGFIPTEEEKIAITFNNKSKTTDLKKGTMRMGFKDTGTGIAFQDTVHTPGMRHNILSVSRLADKGIKSDFGKHKVTLLDTRTGRMLTTGKRIGRLYVVFGCPYDLTSGQEDEKDNAVPNAEEEDEELIAVTESASVATFTTGLQEGDHRLLWHLRMGHLNYDALDKLRYDHEFYDLASGMTYPKKCPRIFCEACVLAKATTSTYLTKKDRSENLEEDLEGSPIDVGETEEDSIVDAETLSTQSKMSHNPILVNKCAPLEKLSVDLVGPFPVKCGNSRYVLCLMDHGTKYVWVYLLARKSDAEILIRNLLKQLQKKFGRMPEKFLSDNGREFTVDSLARFLAEEGIEQVRTPPYTPQLNGKQERMHRTLGNMVWAMFKTAPHLPSSVWGFLWQHAAYIKNRSPTSIAEDYKTPMELLQGNKPDLSSLRVIGSKCYATVPKAQRKKLMDKARIGYFLGIDVVQRAYIVLRTDTGRMMYL
jgi:hypothetical protein